MPIPQTQVHGNTCAARYYWEVQEISEWRSSRELLSSIFRLQGGPCKAVAEPYILITFSPPFLWLFASVKRQNSLSLSHHKPCSNWISIGNLKSPSLSTIWFQIWILLPQSSCDPDLLSLSLKMPSVYGGRMTTFEDFEKESEYGYVRKVLCPPIYLSVFNLTVLHSWIFINK